MTYLLCDQCRAGMTGTPLVGLDADEIWQCAWCKTEYDGSRLRGVSPDTLMTALDEAQTEIGRLELELKKETP